MIMMNKYEKKINKALTQHENRVPFPEHGYGWIYRKLNKWAKKISKKKLEDFCVRLMLLLKKE